MWMTRVSINHPVFATMVMVAITVLGFIGACLMFALSYSRIGVIRRHLTRYEFASNVERSPEQTRLLREEGRIRYLGLADYAELEQLLAALREAGIPIDELALAETDLEQVFLRIMAGSEKTDDARPVLTVPEA